MTRTYTLKIISDFAAAHALRDYPGECSRLHGHNWKVEVEISATSLDSLGMGLDFKTIRQGVLDITKALDHRYLNEIPPFDRINPTAENIAEYLFEGIATILNDERIQVSAVTLWETERASVRYQYGKHTL